MSEDTQETQITEIVCPAKLDSTVILIMLLHVLLVDLGIQHLWKEVYSVHVRKEIGFNKMNNEW